MILLDTHAYYWFIMDDPHLPVKVKNLIEDEESVFVSSASFWEMTIKSSLGKMELPASISKMMDACKEMNINILDIKKDHLEHLQKLPWIHKDPFDRLIIAQALTADMTLVTVDRNIVKYDVKTYWE